MCLNLLLKCGCCLLLGKLLTTLVLCFFICNMGQLFQSCKGEGRISAFSGIDSQVMCMYFYLYVCVIVTYWFYYILYQNWRSSFITSQALEDGVKLLHRKLVEIQNNNLRIERIQTTQWHKTILNGKQLGFNRFKKRLFQEFPYLAKGRNFCKWDCHKSSLPGEFSLPGRKQRGPLAPA